MMDKLISELIDLPERVRKGDFVLNLSKGVTEPEPEDWLVEQYVVTPQLVRCRGKQPSNVRLIIDRGDTPEAQRRRRVWRKSPGWRSGGIEYNWGGSL